MTELRIAHRSAVVVLDGTEHRVRRGRTLAVAAHPIVVDHPDLWRPLVVDYDVDDEPVAAPVEPAPKPPKPKAAAKKATQGE